MKVVYLQGRPIDLMDIGSAWRSAAANTENIVKKFIEGLGESLSLFMQMLAWGSPVWVNFAYLFTIGASAFALFLTVLMRVGVAIAELIILFLGAIWRVATFCAVHLHEVVESCVPSIAALVPVPPSE